MGLLLMHFTCFGSRFKMRMLEPKLISELRLIYWSILMIGQVQLEFGAGRQRC
jgi:hypothetical protein